MIDEAIEDAELRDRTEGVRLEFVPFIDLPILLESYAASAREEKWLNR